MQFGTFKGSSVLSLVSQHSVGLQKPVFLVDKSIRSCTLGAQLITPTELVWPLWHPRGQTAEQRALKQATLLRLVFTLTSQNFILGSLHVVHQNLCAQVLMNHLCFCTSSFHWRLWLAGQEKRVIQRDQWKSLRSHLLFLYLTPSAKLLNHNPAQFSGREDLSKQVKQSIFVQLLQVYL